MLWIIWTIYVLSNIFICWAAEVAYNDGIHRTNKDLYEPLVEKYGSNWDTRDNMIKMSLQSLNLFALPIAIIASVITVMVT